MSVLLDNDVRIEYLGTNPTPDVPIYSIILLSLIGHTIIFYCLPSSIKPMTKSVLTKVGHPCHFYLLMEELSTIPLNLRSIYHDRPCAYKGFSILFAITFISSRLIYGTIICVYTFLSGPRFIELALKAGDMKSVILVTIQITLCLSARCLNFYWGALIARKICRPKNLKKPKAALNDINDKKKTS
ncbi:unnamed protein product [Rotaria sp. Silwood2]|nr:unnamed protein product [Rotaria sp. Silwood2]CAF3142412.1 unnamed protein product [Rotaria sp. Silwood2]CAF4516693.1 unnamed protein product [Rotaria sp. Silwood2]